jgi:hypothetical protein
VGLKWFFAINEGSLVSQRSLWEPLMRAAVRSAQARTTLEPNLLYDGDPGDPFVRELASMGVRVRPHRVSFHAALEAHPSANPAYARMAGGAFLRVEIPLVEREARHVLYTDCDVIFLREPRLPWREPRLFSCAPEFDRRDLARFNTGVMWMNLPRLRADLPAFTAFITSHLDDFVTFDQDAYRQFYRGRVTRLPRRLNWRAYWGDPARADILHFHGPKPSYIAHLLDHPDDRREPGLHELFHADPAAFRRALALWREAAGEG